MPANDWCRNYEADRSLMLRMTSKKVSSEARWQYRCNTEFPTPMPVSDQGDSVETKKCPSRVAQDKNVTTHTLRASFLSV
jgi:hypothetical protein